jgi:hypothetical protein
MGFIFFPLFYPNTAQKARRRGTKKPLGALRHRGFGQLNRVLKNKHQTVRQDMWRFGKRSPPEADEHLQKPPNTGSRP